MARFGFFLTWWALVLLGALDASLFVFIPFGTDAVVIYMCARNQNVLVVSTARDRSVR